MIIDARADLDLVVLIVDDEPEVARQLAEGLEVSGFRTLVVNDASQALDLLGKRPEVGVVITDIRMPGLDGYALASQLAQMTPDAQAIEVVAMTGHAAPEDTEAAVRAGVCDFIRKPFRLARAVEAARKAMRRASKRRLADKSRRAQAARLDEEAARRARLESELGSVLQRLDTVLKQPAPQNETARRLRSVVSHALRTPLNMMTLSAELLASEAGVPAKSENMQILRTALLDAERAVKLLEEMLQGAPPRLEDMVELSLRPAVERAVAAARTRHPDKTITLLDGEDVGNIRAVPVTLARALELAIDAGFESIPSAGRMSVSLATTRDDAGDWTLLTIVLPGGTAEVALPAGRCFPPAENVFACPMQSLPFAVARHWFATMQAELSSLALPDGTGALRVALPKIPRS